MRAVLVAVCLALLLAGCGGRLRESHARPPEAPMAKRLPVAASTGCGASHDTGVTERMIRFGGLDRSYRLAVPTSYDGSTPVPLVLNFHGLGSNARQEERYTRIVEYAEKYGFIAVSVDGTGELRRWTLAVNGAVDDAGFVRA